jgi:hypothetical protein
MTHSHLHYRLSGHGAAIETAACVAPRTVARTDHASFMGEAPADLAFNRGLRRHPTLIATGDLPRFALLRTRPEAKMDPSFIKLGDGRIRLSVDGGQPFWLDEAEGIRTTFLPHATEQRLPLPGPAGLACVLTVAHAANWGLVARLVIHNGSAVGRKVDVELVFGGLSVHGRTFSAAYFNPAQADQEAPQTSIQDHDGVAVMTREAFPETVAAALLPRGAWSAANGRAAFRHACEVAPGAEAGCGLVAGWGEDAAATLARVRAAEPEALLREAEAHAQALLDAAVIRTPDAVLDAAFACAVLELDRVWYDPAWLEGGHWWSAPWCNDFQILAALNLGQYARVRRTLEYCDSTDIGPCPNLMANGHPDPGLASERWGGGRLDGLPYYARQFLDYLAATDDEELARRILPRLHKSLEHLWATCDADGDGLLHWKKGCNCFLYQADHLALPGHAASPSLMLAGVLDGLAVWAERVGEQATATAWRARAELIRENLVKKLWDEQDGAFYSHLDNQGIAHRARFYTDLVFPTLYSGLPEDYGRRSLEYLDRRLRVNVPAPETGAALALMRVGELKPNIFGNDNCMPAQMAEAARAYAALGRSADAHALLHGVALGSTLFTESPGSFPERLGHDGKGEPNYMFGNPIGSYLSGIVDGLFGLRLIEGGRALQVAPALPADWPEAAITVPYGRLTCRAGAEADGVRVVRLEVTHASVRAARFAPWLPLKRVLVVSLNGVAVEDWKLKSGVGAWAVCVDAPPAARHELLIRFAPETPPATEVVMSATAQEPVPPAVVPAVRGALRHLELSAAFNAGHLSATSRWANRSPRDFKELRANGKVETGLGPFRVATGETCLAFAEFGVCDPISGKIKRSAHPATVTVPVGARIEALNLLYATELASRLTGSQAGRLELRYATGAAVVIPLVVGVQLDTLFSHFASATVPVPTGVDWGCANAWRVLCDPRRELVSAIVQIEVADVQFGLLAASINEATCPTDGRA